MVYLKYTADIVLQFTINTSNDKSLVFNGKNIKTFFALIRIII